VPTVGQTAPGRAGSHCWRKTKRPRVLVRCLGPDEDEHSFMSVDAKRDRICGACRERLEVTPPAPMYDRVVQILHG
jgi:hypothetical protein